VLTFSEDKNSRGMSGSGGVQAPAEEVKQWTIQTVKTVEEDPKLFEYNPKGKRRV